MRTFRARLAFLLVALCVSLPAAAQMTLVSTTTFSGASVDEGYGLARAANGDLYVAGTSSNPVTGADIWLARYDSSFVLQSTRTINGTGNEYDVAYNVAVATDGTVYAVGYASMSGYGNAGWMGRYSSSLVLLSSATFPAPSQFSGNLLRGVAFTSTGELFTAGNFGVTTGTCRIQLAKHDPVTLAIISSVTFTNGFNNPEAEALAADTSGYLYVTGSVPPAPATSNDLWLAKYDTSLVFQASTTRAGPAGNSDMGRAILVHPNGSVYVTGIINNSGPTNDIWVGRYDSSLILQSSMSINGSASNKDEGNGLALGNGGDILLSASITQTGASDDIFYGEYTSGLALVSSKTLSSAGSATDVGYAIVSDTTTSQAWVAGTYGVNGQDIWLGKFAITPAVPTAPSSIGGTAQSSGTILWTWTDNSVNETGFRVMLGGSNLSGDLAANTTFWLQSGLTPNATSGTLLARAFNGSGTADSGSLQRYSLTDPPNSITATFFGSSVAFTWPTMTNPPGTRWAVDRATDGVNYAQLYFSSAAAAYTDNTGMLLGTSYYYRIRAANGDGVYSAHANATAIVFTGGGVPAAPSGFAGAAQSTTSILWSWTDNSSDESGFRVMSGAANLSGDLAANTTSWTLSGLTVNASTGPLFVQAFNSTGTTNSGTASRFTWADVPTGLAAPAVYQSSAVLTWAGAATLYQLERSTGGAFSIAATTNALGYTDTALASASTYFYRILGLNGDGVATAYASSITFVTAVSVTTPAAPSGFGGVAQSTSAILWSWTDNAVNESGYRVMAGTTNLSGDLAANASTWLQTGLTANVSSGTLFARAFNAGGTADSTTTARFTFAAAPGTAAASGVFATSATLSWTTGGNPAGTTYQLQRSTGGAFGQPFAGAATSYLDAALTPGATHQYKVRALNGDGIATAFSATSAVVAQQLPPIPAPASIAPAGALVGASPAVAVTGTGFDATATLTLEKMNPDAGVWAATGSFTTARMLGSLTKLRDGRVLLAGGMLEGAAAGLAQADLFDPVTGTWSAAAPLSNGRNQFASALLPDGRVLIAGGQNSTGAFTNTASIYDPLYNTWSPAASMSVNRTGFNLTVLSTGKVLAAGGWDGATKQASAELYDPAANTWTAAASMSAGRVSPSATVLANGKVLVAGDSGGTAASVTAEIYDPVGNTWTPTGSMNKGRYSHAAALLPDGRVLAVSGSTGSFVTATADVYDAATGSWTATGPMAMGRLGHALVLVAGVPLAIAGQNDSAALSTTEIYDAASNAWHAGPALAGGVRAYPLAATLDDGRILVASGRAGWTGGANMNSAEVLGMTAASIAATGVSIPDAQHVNGTVNLTGAATGYWDAVVRQTGGRTGRLGGGFLVASVPGVPGTPVGTALGTASLSWTWTLSLGATSYNLYRASDGVYLGSSAAGPFVQSGLATNTPYGLRAAGVNGGGMGALSTAATVYTAAAVPGTPSAAGVYQTSGTLSWTNGGNPAGTVFELIRSTGTGYGLQFSGTATTYFDGYLTAGATHFFRVRALNGDGIASAYSATATVVAVAPPPTPGSAGTPVGTALGTSSITWTWVLASGATTHNVYRASDNSYLGQSIAGPYVQAALTPNTAYGLKAAGVNVGGVGPLSPSGTAYTLATAPSGAAVSSVTATSLVVSWGLNGNPGTTSASLERSTNGVSYSTWSSGAITSYADTGLLGCTTYYYRVRNVNGDGLFTAYNSFTGVTSNTVPSPPSGFTATANGGGTVTLSWDLSPTEGVTGYRLYWDSGSGTVNYAAPIASPSSGTASYTTGVLTSSASYTFALRTAHRCGVIETTGALATSGAAVAPPALRAVIKEPDSGKRVHGNRLTILGELIYGTPSDAQQVLFQYKLATSTAWLDIDEANVNHPNPDFSFPYFVHADVNSIAPGDYDLRAVAYNLSGVPDSAPPSVRVTVVAAAINADIDENDLSGAVQKNQTVNNTVTSVIDTAGAGSTDPSVRVVLPPGAVNAATATISVIANPTITTAAPAGQALVGSAIKIDLSNGQSALNGLAAITLTYPDTVRYPSLLQIYYLNEATGQWSRDFTSTVDTSSRTVTGNTPHFSTFALLLGTSFASNLDSVQVYPVPFKPNGGSADEGRPFSAGDPNSGIIFANLAMGSEIKIYTLTGRLVASLENIPVTGSVRWDARNQDGRDVASGAYFAVIKAAGFKTVVKKLVIIR